MDLGHWPADGKARVKKVGRTLDKPQSRTEINRILSASDEDSRAWSDQPLLDEYVSALAKPRCLECCGVGTRDATNVSSTHGGTSTAAVGAGVLAFGSLDAAVGEAS